MFLAACRNSVEIVRDEEFSQVTYRARTDHCMVSIQVPLNRTKLRGFSYSTDHATPWPQELSLISRLLESLIKKGEFQLVGWIAWEPLYYTPELSRRLALAALRSQEWDRKKGKPKSMSLSEFTVKIMNEGGVFGDVAAIFKRKKIHLVVTNVEKIGVLQAEQTSFFEELKKEGAAPSDKFPVDCLTSLSVSWVNGAVKELK